MVGLILKFFRMIYGVIEVFVLSASFFVVVYLFLMQPHQVKGNSMVPNFQNGEYLLTDKVTFKRREPIYGEVIVFKAPINENFDFIKRVIAVAGDRIRIQGKKVYVNGKILNESAYLPADFATLPGQFLRSGVEFEVPEGTVFAFGDNRSHSSDSREWGPIPLENIIGRAFLRYWPPNLTGLITNPVGQ